MDRVAIVGASGSGKTTLAHELGARRGLTVIDLDTLYHRPGWEPISTPEFRALVAEQLEGAARWVVAGNYTMVADLVHGSADTIVWLAATGGGPVAAPGTFWHDRTSRPTHRMKKTEEQPGTLERFLNRMADDAAPYLPQAPIRDAGSTEPETDTTS